MHMQLAWHLGDAFLLAAGGHSHTRILQVLINLQLDWQLDWQLAIALLTSNLILCNCNLAAMRDIDIDVHCNLLLVACGSVLYVW